MTNKHLETAKGSLSGLNLLVVDDSIDNLEILKFFLSQQGAKVDEANGGNAALSLAAVKKYDLILMDIQMPEIDGHQTVQLLRQQNYQAPIVALTAHLMEKERERSLASGFNDHVTKPINFEMLIQTILKWVR